MRRQVPRRNPVDPALHFFSDFRIADSLDMALPLFLGTTSGSLGETSAAVILICGAYLAWRGFLNWRTPASIFATVA